MVELVAVVGQRRDQIHEHDAAADATHAEHLVDRLARIGEVMQRAAAEHDVEGLVEERQRLRVRLLQQHVRDAGVAEALARRSATARA